MNWWVIPIALVLFGVISLIQEDDGFPSGVFIFAAICLSIGHFL